MFIRVTTTFLLAAVLLLNQVHAQNSSANASSAEAFNSEEAAALDDLLQQTFRRVFDFAKKFCLQ